MYNCQSKDDNIYSHDCLYLAVAHYIFDSILSYKPRKLLIPIFMPSLR